jgi:transcriptional regulator with GAF, ATPase, and Fis domain
MLASMRSSDPRSLADARNAARNILLGERAGGAPLEDWRSAFPEIIGRSTGLMRVLEMVSKVARSDSNVMILGESGTGKELIAAAIHRLSMRSDRPYVMLNATAIPETLLESEMFGHEKGAFTGADRRRVGRFEEADTGTLFLDEIGDMPASLQAKLLRVIQEKKFSPLGGNEVRSANVRIVAATNVNLQAAVVEKRFREDLFYRLNVLPIILPPLRDRADDVVDLLEHFVALSNRAHAKVHPLFFSPDAKRLLTLYNWPGNIRELQNLVERLVVTKAGGAVEPDDLPDGIRNLAHTGSVTLQRPVQHPDIVGTSPSMPLAGRLHQDPIVPASFGKLPESGLDLVKFIEDLENGLIIQALERTGNNRNQAAKLLGLNRTTLVERIKKRRLTTLNEPSKEL